MPEGHYSCCKGCANIGLEEFQKSWVRYYTEKQTRPLLYVILRRSRRISDNLDQIRIVQENLVTFARITN